MSKRKICVATGTRAEYGLLRYLIEAIRDSIELELQLIVTGMHLSPEFGLTYREIEADGFHIDRKVEMLLSSDTPVGIAKATGLGMIGFADALDQLKPDILVVLGDRYEILAAATAAFFARIPIAHIHGGETTEGVIDEGIRHSVTKMSTFHFVAAKQYQARVIQMGESPQNVHLVGGLGVDGIANTDLLSKETLEHELKFKFGKQNLIITFHPVTLENATSEQQFHALLDALEQMPEDVFCVFTKGNADTDGRVINTMIDRFISENPIRSAAFTSLGQRRFWSFLAVCDAIVGNSSSGLLEAPTFGIPTVNIGDRQRGRVSCESVIQCGTTSVEIAGAIRESLSNDFAARAGEIQNPYGKGGASRKSHNFSKQVRLIKSA